jgi:hypothetical protein
MRSGAFFDGNSAYRAVSHQIFAGFEFATWFIAYLRRPFPIAANQGRLAPLLCKVVHVPKLFIGETKVSFA